MRTVGWRIVWKKIIAVIEAPFPVANRKPENIQWPAPSWLVRSIGRALHRYRRGQGFESRTSLNNFSGFLFATAQVASITAMIFFHINYLFSHTTGSHTKRTMHWPLISTPKITSITGQNQLINGWQEIETRYNNNQNYDTTLNANTTPKTHEGWMGGWGRSGNGRWQQKQQNSKTPCDPKTPVHSNLYAIRVLEKRFSALFSFNQWKTPRVLMRTY